MKKLAYYSLNKYNEVAYIKRFIDGVTSKELEEMFRKHLLDGFMTILLGTSILKEKREAGL